MKKTVCMALVFIFLGTTGLIYGQNLIPPIREGDVNEDNKVNIVDALLVAQYYIGLDPAGLTNPRVADVNKSYIIDIVDALLISQFYVGLISEFPVIEEDFHISVAETITISLSTTPSTGYEWFYTIDNPDLLVLDSDRVTNCGTLPGSPCDHFFVFKGLAAGEVDVTFDYYRDFDDPIVILKSITYTIYIHEG